MQHSARGVPAFATKTRTAIMTRLFLLTGGRIIGGSSVPGSLFLAALAGGLEKLLQSPLHVLGLPPVDVEGLLYAGALRYEA